MQNKQISEALQQKTSCHPCFAAEAHQYARLHLPIAPMCNIQCNYCNRKFDCPNETRPGVTSRVLSPAQAEDLFVQVKAKLPHLTVVGISGPGDPLANFEEVYETVKRIRRLDDITFCLSTNGLQLARHAEALAEAGVTHFTVTMNAIDPAISAKIYKYVNGDGTIYTGIRAAAFLLERQLAGLEVLSHLDVVCKVNIVAIQGINDKHIRDVVSLVKGYKVSMTNITGLINVPGTPFENQEELQPGRLREIRDECSALMPQLYHCRQCRADAIGQLNRDVSREMYPEHACLRKNLG